ncbi:hypothetical protein ACVWZ6_003251 [Bradyrhizobium sp. GM6.1]
MDEKFPALARSCCSALELQRANRATLHLTSSCKARLSGAVLTVAAAIGFGLASPASCFAQTEPKPSVNDYLPPSEPEVSRDEWRQRIEDARRRAKEVSRERRDHPELYKPVPEDPDLVATERLLNDDSLQRGDIVSTKKGMFVYQGRPDQPRREQDFVPIAPKATR